MASKNGILGFGLKQGRNEAPFLHLYSLYGLSVKYMAKLQYVKPPVNQQAKGQLISKAIYGVLDSPKK